MATLERLLVDASASEAEGLLGEALREAREAEDPASAVEGVVAVGVRHRLGRVRRATLSALADVAREWCDRRDLTFALTGGGSGRVNHFGALTRDVSPHVRAEFVRLCDSLLRDENGEVCAHAPRVLPYVLSALGDDIDDVRRVAEAVSTSSLTNFQDVVCRNLGDMLLPTLAELKNHAESGWSEDIIVRALTLTETMVRVAENRSTQFVPNVCDALLHAWSSTEPGNAKRRRIIKNVRDTLTRSCPDASEYVSAILQFDD
ncbi:Armadillo-type fold [Ostreococcus tauri]|uniref:Armadillo-type fold n=1 Tax=Ostreococcus tauri TaxID=70448 RepID=Q01D13_OSTTA|nr:Armadillo-type fold [Ostreococcus tauri]OUS43751.1 hypothetical protein BE221DRAFT_207042 [Ostreococcus tauri]CAL52790.1 Armadillo-type fold [Ostreococcus tauri]|eukprot:XP_003078050.1 Armadillo-type fold [Ostreococcus tauri]